MQDIFCVYFLTTVEQTEAITGRALFLPRKNHKSLKIVLPYISLLKSEGFKMIIHLTVKNQEDSFLTAIKAGSKHETQKTQTIKWCICLSNN